MHSPHKKISFSSSSLVLSHKETGMPLCHTSIAIRQINVRKSKYRTGHISTFHPIFKQPKSKTKSKKKGLLKFAKQMIAGAERCLEKA